MSKAFHLEKAEIGPVWDRCVKESPQANLFWTEAFLNANPGPFSTFWIKQNQELKALLLVPVSESGQIGRDEDFVIHTGVLFARGQNRTETKLRHEQFQILQFIAEELPSSLNGIELSLHPSVQDIRPFLWYRYNDPTPGKRWSISIRYTCYLDLTQLHGEDLLESPFSKNMETVRRYEVRDAKKKGGSVRISDKIDLLIEFYRETMIRQNQPQPRSKLDTMLKICTTLRENRSGKLYEVLDDTGTALAYAFYGWDQSRAYYLYGASNPTAKKSWQGSLLHWEAFVDLAKSQQINEVDLEGVNSPNRGWFKLSFGGRLIPYYSAKLSDSVS